MLRIVAGDSIAFMDSLPPASVDAIVTDPPYELGFMGRAWDRAGTSFDPATWEAALRVLKPGGHLAAFGGSRTFHRIAVAIEDAGFELRDTLSWLYGSGFPKSADFAAIPGCEPRTPRPEFVGTAFEAGWGTALKPAWEPVILARKPLAGTVAATVAAHGTGALNIDACRIPVEDASYARNCSGDRGHDRNRRRQLDDFAMTAGKASAIGRWPANVLLDETAAALLDEQSGALTSGKPSGRRNVRSQTFGQAVAGGELTGYGDTGGASRFFYVAKASRAERGALNHHPTVKPVALMRWLLRMLVPPGGLVVDPFLGSGTTLLAAAAEGVAAIGVERSLESVAVSRRRLRLAAPLLAPRVEFFSFEI